MLTTLRLTGLLLLSTAMLLACGDDSANNGGGGSGAAGSTTTGSTTTGSTTTGSMTTGSTSSVGAGGGAAQILEMVTDVVLSADCMPAVGSDPVSGWVGVAYQNVGTAPGSLSLVQASLDFANPMEAWSFPINLDPISSGSVAAGETLVVQHLKVATPGDASFICQLCGQPGNLSLRWTDDDGGELNVDIPTDLACVF